ncbi:MAG: glycosyltransferase family 2 protein [Pseudomonadota bacterium]
MPEKSKKKEGEGEDIEVSIIIPCYNEIGSLPGLLEGLDAAVAKLKGLDKKAEVVIVDDGSMDGSFSYLKQQAGERDYLLVVGLRKNFGQTAAMSAGIDHGSGRILVFMDADMQNDPDDIPLLLQYIDEGYDVVSGWRKNRKDKLLTRRLPSVAANWIIGRIGGMRLHDYGCTLKAYKREVLAPVKLYGEMHRFLPLHASWIGARIKEVAVRHHPRKHGVSKYGLTRTFKVLLDLLTVKFLGSYSTKPIYLFGGIGMFLCFIGLLVAGCALWQKFMYGVWAHRNPLVLLAVFVFLVGAQLLMMGLLGEMIVRTYHESQEKPTYHIREIVKERSREPEAGSRKKE